MFEASFKFRKTILGCSASILALAAATPAVAQDNTAGTDQPQPKVTPNQIAGPVGPAQVRTGASNSGEIVITGIRASIQASLNSKRNNDMVSEVVTAQDIGKFPDKNVADLLGRLTGVNVVTGSAAAGGFGENSTVSIRGTDPTLNLTLLDGHSIATGDWFVLDQTSGGRSFDFSLLPSEIVGKLEVYKSSEADLPEGGIGGTINLHSRMPLDLPSGHGQLYRPGELQRPCEQVGTAGIRAPQLEECGPHVRSARRRLLSEARVPPRRAGVPRLHQLCELRRIGADGDLRPT